MRAKVDRKIYASVVQDESGEVKSYSETIRIADEPDFIKVYVDCVLTFKGLRKGLNPIFIALCKHMTYAQIDALNGGQIIYTNKALKEQIAKDLGVKLCSIDKAIVELTKANVLKRIATGTYQVNPDLVGRGDWKAIKNIKATFNFRDGTVKAEVEDDAAACDQARNAQEQAYKLDDNGEFVGQTTLL